MRERFRLCKFNSDGTYIIKDGIYNVNAYFDVIMLLRDPLSLGAFVAAGPKSTVAAGVCEVPGMEKFKDRKITMPIFWFL